jgi:peptidoglycan glycosyltransferase
VGLERVIAQARRLGISTPLHADHNRVLGGDATYLYEMARAYAVMANPNCCPDLIELRPQGSA